MKVVGIKGQKLDSKDVIGEVNISIKPFNPGSSRIKI